MPQDMRMFEVNEARVTGRLVRDAETRQAGSGSVAKFTVAVDTSWYDKTAGERKTRTAFISVDLWNPSDFVLKNLTKGAAVYVDGEITQDKYQDKDGNSRESTRLRARRVEPMGWPEGSTPGGGSGGGNTGNAARPAAPAQKPQSNDDDMPF